MRTQQTILTLALVLSLATPILSAAPQLADTAGSVLLVPDAVWDGTADSPQKGFVVLLRGGRIEAVGRAKDIKAPPDAKQVNLSGATLIPGLIEGHSHLFLHPYNETLWDDQVLKEPSGFRMAEAVAHARATLLAGITTTRDLGTEGAGDYDVQLRRAVDAGVVPGPRILSP
jgi:imidazolonepropionase-like amidohydrolase